MSGHGWALALSVGWAALVVAAAWRVRPATGRLGRLRARPLPTAPGPPSARASGVLGRVMAGVGGAALRVAGRPVTDVSARRSGAAVLVAAVVAALSTPVAAAAAAVFVWALPGVRERSAERRHLRALAAEVPDVVDLLVLAVGSGLTVHLALDRVAARAPGPLGAEIARACADARAGGRLADALDELPSRAGEAVRPLVQALVAAERYGAPLRAGLERLSHEVRRDQRRAAEEAARKVPVKLLFPLVTCTLPAFALLTVAPLVANGVRSISF